MAEFDKNIDQFCDYGYPGFPKRGNNLNGISYKFVDESYYQEPVSIEEFKEYAAIDGSTFDGDIQEILLAARQAVENYLQLSLGIRTVKFSALSVYSNYKLMWGEVDTILTEGYTHFNGILKEGGKEVEIEFDTTDYYGGKSDIKLAVKKQALSYYENKEKYLEGNRELDMVIDEVRVILNKYRNVTFP